MGMTCLRCGFENPPGMRFCGNCGTRLAPTASLKKSVIAEGSPEVSDLGVMMGADLAERLQQAGLEARGQRRNVSVLFADLSGYTALSGRIDGEDLFELVQQFVQVLSNNVYKYEGIVDKLTGDGLMALFGAPISHENNAERAVRAAIDMQNEIAQMSRQMENRLHESLNLRIGIHSGSVIVGGIGTNLMMDYTAIGDTVNLARRIEEAAPSGAVLISEAVFRQVRAFFDCQQVSVLNPKGVSQPVVAYRVVGQKARPGQTRGIEGLRAPMVGRNSELAQLKHSALDLLQNQKGCLTIITGEAGLGKSRLTEEFIASLDQTAFRVLQGQSLVYRRVAYWIIRELLYDYLDLPSNTPPLTLRQRLSRSMYQLMGDQANENLIFLEHMLGLPYSDSNLAERLDRLTPEQLREQIFLAVRDLIFMESTKKPLILILDDLHWADEASLEMIRYLVELLQQVPIYILAISRQVLEGQLEGIVAWAELHLGGRYQRIDLHSLSDDQSARLLYLLLSIPDFPEKLGRQILSRSSGNPLYLEETLRMLIDEGIVTFQDKRWYVTPGANQSSLGVPTTLSQLVLARFDRLENMQRIVLQVASVIGKDFSLPVLNSVLQRVSAQELHAAIDELVQREFILPVEGTYDTDYTFRHIMMSDAIYGTMLRKERNKLHGQVAETIELLFSDHLDEQVELLANHYRWSPNLDKALHYLCLAGQKAERNQLNEQARAHYKAALDILPLVQHSSYQAYQVYQGLGDADVFVGEYPQARKYYQKAIQLLADDAPQQYIGELSTLLRKSARTHERQGDYDQALVYLSRAGKILQNSEKALPVEQAEIWNDIAWIHFRRGNFTETEGLLKQALDLVISTDASAVIASIYNRLGGVAYNQGDWEKAAASLRKSIAIRESIRDLSGLATSFNNLGLLEIELGQLNSALEHLTRSYELKKRQGQSEGIAMALNNLGWLQIQRGEFEAAKQALDESLNLTRQIGYSSLEGEVLKNLGELSLSMQDWQEANQKLSHATQALAELGANDQLIDTYRLLGEVSLGEDDIPTAVAFAEKAEQLIEKHMGNSEELSAVQRGELNRFRGMLAIRLQDWKAAKTYLEDSETTFQKLSSRLYQARADYQLGVLAVEMHDSEKAKNHLMQAARLFEQDGAKSEALRAKKFYKQNFS